MFSLFKRNKTNTIKNIVAGFNHTVVGPARYEPTSNTVKNSWGNVVVPAAVLHWVLENINVGDFRVGRIKLVNDEYRLTYHFKNEADAVTFKMDFC